MSCPECGEKMQRTPEVIDCWFDSGSMPFAQWHYPFENKDIFDEKLFPADFICEGIDQTRGWFYTLLAISTILRDEPSYKNVLVNDLILDKKGQKMSKSRGNTLDPMELMEKYGADAVRWYLYSVSSPWVPTKFDPAGVKEVMLKFFGTLKNVYSFYSTYANIDKFNASDYELTDKKDTEIDRWIMSRMNTVIKKVVSNNNNYDLTRSVRAIQSFVIDDVSNWYVRRSRRRYWSMELTDDKREAYLTLYQILVGVCKLIAPFAPFLSDLLYRNLSGEQSVHLVDYPQVNEEVIDLKLEDEMKVIIDIVTMGRAARNKAQMKVRQTLSTIYVPEKYKHVVTKMEDLIKEEINIKEVKYIQSKDDFVEYDIKPNYKALGPKYGKHMKHLVASLKEIDANHIVSAFHKGEPFYLEVDGVSCKISEDDVFVSIKDKDGLIFEGSKEKYIALDTNLNDELIKEGLARELVNKIQFTRKENDFDIMDRIDIFFYANDEIANVFDEFADYIKSETLADNYFREREKHEDMKKWDVNGKEVYISLLKK